MDIVFIKDLRIETIIGIYEQERVNRQLVVIDLEMASDVGKAAATENIDDALDYHALSLRLQEFVGASSFQLVETLAEAIAALVLEEFSVGWLKLTLHKPDALEGSTDVGICIERSS